MEVAHETDPTRPVTQALFRPNVSHDYDDGLADMLDVVGQNYREKEILAAHEQKPSRKILGTENTHDRNQWMAVRDHAPYAGQFLWTGMDYLGESRRWPVIGHGSGLLDRTGAIRPLGARTPELVERHADGRHRAPHRRHGFDADRSRLRRGRAAHAGFVFRLDAEEF